MKNLHILTRFLHNAGHGKLPYGIFFFFFFLIRHKKIKILTIEMYVGQTITNIEKIILGARQMYL